MRCLPCFALTDRAQRLVRVVAMEAICEEELRLSVPSCAPSDDGAAEVIRTLGWSAAP